MSRINIARQFGRYPAGRYYTDGKYSGERFREEFLLPALKAGGDVVVELDGVRGYGSSFLEEVFGGAVRSGVPAREMLGRVKLESKDSILVLEITKYIKDAGGIA